MLQGWAIAPMPSWIYPKQHRTATISVHDAFVCPCLTHTHLEVVAGAGGDVLGSQQDLLRCPSSHQHVHPRQDLGTRVLVLVLARDLTRLWWSRGPQSVASRGGGGRER